MVNKVKAFIEENRLLQYGDAVIVALSGGADSVTLLHILLSIRDEYRLTLRAAHLNHGIRGEEARRDEAFAEELCGAWNVPLDVRHADIPSLARQSGKSEELCGREERYRFFDELSAMHGARIATAHNRDDNAETVLWNLVRGSGLGGLSGIPAKRGNIIRPLLCCPRAEIEAYCAGNGLRYVTDSTNLTPMYTRNLIRLRVMPLLRELNANADGNIARTASILRDADAYLEYISEKELNNCSTSYGYACDKLLKLDKTVLRYALKRLIADAGAPVDHRHVELLTETLASGGAVELGGGYTAVCAQGILRIVREETDAAECQSIPLSAYPNAVRIQIKDGKIYCRGELLSGQKINKLFVNSLIPCDIITDDTVVRARREGDTFTDTARGVTKSLKKLLNERKIPRELRGGLRLVADGSRVLWIEGVGAAQRVDLSRDQEAVWMLTDKG